MWELKLKVSVSDTFNSLRPIRLQFCFEFYQKTLTAWSPGSMTSLWAIRFIPDFCDRSKKWWKARLNEIACHRMIVRMCHHAIVCYHVSWNCACQRVIMTIMCDHMITQCALSCYSSLSLSSCDDTMFHDSMSSCDHVLSCDDIDTTLPCVDNNGVGVLLCNNMIACYHMIKYYHVMISITHHHELITMA